MKVKKYIVIKVDHSSVIDRRGHVAKTFDSLEDAETYVKSSVQSSNDEYQWSIEEVDIDVPKRTYMERLNELRNDIENDVALSYRTKTSMIESIMAMMRA